MKNKGYSAPSVKKAFKILQTIADSPKKLGVSELAKKLKNLVSGGAKIKYFSEGQLKYFYIN